MVFDITLITFKYDDGKLLCTGTYNKDQAIRTDKMSTATLEGSDVKANKITFTELDAHKGEIEVSDSKSLGGASFMVKFHK